MLLLVQPASRLLFREQDPTGRFYRLLEDRENVDRLLRRLDELEADTRDRGHLKEKSGVTGRISNKQEG